MFRASAVHAGRRLSTRSTATTLTAALSDIEGQLANAGVDWDEIETLRVSKAVGKTTVRISPLGKRKPKAKQEATANGEKPAPASPKPAPAKPAATAAK